MVRYMLRVVRIWLPLPVSRSVAMFWIYGLFVIPFNVIVSAAFDSINSHIHIRMHLFLRFCLCCGMH